MDQEIEFEDTEIRSRGKRLVKYYFIYTLVKSVLLTAILISTPYKETGKLYTFFVIYSTIELSELLWLIFIYILKILHRTNRCQYPIRLVGIACECLRLIAVAGISIELLSHSEWIISPIGLMSIYIVLLTIIKLILFSIFLLFVCALLRNYLVSLRSQNNLEFDTETLNNFIVDSVQEGTECSICLEDCGKDKEWVVLACQHSFHHECLNEWAIINGICPVCRRNINAG